MADDRHIVRTAQVDWAQGWRGRHPFNPASDMTFMPLSDPTGMSRLGVKLIRIPPGKESFIPHAHSVEEEFVFVLEGAGVMVLDRLAPAVGPGDRSDDPRVRNVCFFPCRSRFSPYPLITHFFFLYFFFI